MFILLTCLSGTPVTAVSIKMVRCFKTTVGAAVSVAASGCSITIIDACSGTDYYEVYTYVYTATTATSVTWSYFMGTTI